MGIILLILKIIGWLLLSLVGLLLLAILTVLFVPICYEISGNKGEQVIVNGSVTWLAKIFRLKFDYENEFKSGFYILWKRTGGSSEKVTTKKRKTRKKKSSQKEIKKKEEAAPSVIEDKTQLNKDIEYHDSKADSEDVKIDSELTKEAETVISKDEIKKTEKKHKSKSKSKKGKLISKAKGEDTLGKIKKIFKDETYQGVVKFVMQHGWKIVKALLPKKVRISIEMGLDDPASTGYVLGLLSMFYAVLGQSLTINPNFEKKVFTGEFRVKGRIWTFIILFHALKIYFDKRVKRLIEEFN